MLVDDPDSQNITNITVDISGYPDIVEYFDFYELTQPDIPNYDLAKTKIVNNVRVAINQVDYRINEIRQYIHENPLPPVATGSSLIKYIEEFFKNLSVYEEYHMLELTQAMRTFLSTEESNPLIEQRFDACKNIINLSTKLTDEQKQAILYSINNWGASVRFV